LSFIVFVMSFWALIITRTDNKRHIIDVKKLMQGSTIPMDP
jgi:hypothetical protein